MSRSKSDSKSSCHDEGDKADEVYSGYLSKSPPSGQMKNAKSWKRRFFVLAKTNDSNHELKYYRTTERDRHINSIAVSTITQLYMRPESHSAFEWIFRNLKCSSSCVLFMKAEDPKDKAQREYFFIADTSEEADRWFNALYGVMKKTKSDSQSETQNMVKSNSSDQNPCETTVEGRPPVPPRKKSAFEGMTTQYGPCSQSSKNSPSAREVCKEMGKKETLDQTAGSSDEDMSSGQSLTDSSEVSLLDCVTKAFDSLKEPTESARNSSSTKLNGCDPHKREPHTFVEKEICISHHELKSLIFTEEDGKLCVSECQQIQLSRMFKKGDQIVAFNDLLIGTVEEIHAYIRRLNKDEVKLTIRWLSDQKKTT